MKEQTLYKCPSCGAAWTKNEEKCQYCNTPNPHYNVGVNLLNNIVTPIKEKIDEQKNVTVVYTGKVVNKYIYVFLAIFFGAIGVHKFYAGKIGTGIIYLILLPTGIPIILSLVEGFTALARPADKNGNIQI